MSLRPRVVSSLVALLVVALWGDVSRAVVISEIMYHSSELEDQRYEYIELYNENLDPLDLGGFRLTNGVSFEFPEGTWLDGHSFILWWLVLGPYTDWACNQGVARLAADWLREGTGGVEETDLVWRDGQVVDTDHGLAESAGLHANAGAALPTIKEHRSFSDTVDLSDGVRILLHLFAGGALDCQDAADVDDDELLGVTDPIYLFDYLFKAGTAPRAPYPGEGRDPDGTTLGCSR